MVSKSPHTVVMVTIVVTNVHLPATRGAPLSPMYLPKGLVQLVNDDGALVKTSPGHNRIIATKGALLGQACEVVVKADVILHKGLKVISVVTHVPHHRLPVTH